MASARLVLILLLFFGISSCSTKKKFDNWQDYREFISSENSGLSQVKKTKDVTIEVKFLPASYIAYRDLRKLDIQESQKNLDSIAFAYMNTVSFSLRIKTNVKSNKPYLLYHGITNEADYKTRIHLLSFRMNDFLSIKSGSVNLQPQLVVFDGHNELAQELNFTVVYNNPVDLYSNDIDFVFDDPFWTTGTSHFIFNKEDLKSLPDLILDN